MRSETDFRDCSLDDSLVRPSGEGSSWTRAATPRGPRPQTATEATPATQVRVLDEGLVAWRDRRAWHLVELARIPECAPASRPFDVVAGAPVWTLAWYASPLRAHCPHDTYAVSMRALGAAERRRLGLGSPPRRGKPGPRRAARR